MFRGKIEESEKADCFLGCKGLKLQVHMGVLGCKGLIIIGASMSEPHISVTALRTCVCMLACLLACLLAAIYRKV